MTYFESSTGDVNTETCMVPVVVMVTNNRFQLVSSATADSIELVCIIHMVVEVNAVAVRAIRPGQKTGGLSCTSKCLQIQIFC